MIYLIRHTKPAVDKGVCYGWTDLDVDTSFEKELAVIKEKTGDLSSFQFFASPLLRCKRLANALVGDTDITFDDRLKELSFGDWEGITWEAIGDDTIPSSQAVYLTTSEGKDMINFFTKDIGDEHFFTQAYHKAEKACQAIINIFICLPIHELICNLIVPDYGAGNKLWEH